jgi:hypothetical protein
VRLNSVGPLWVITRCYLTPLCGGEVGPLIELRFFNDSKPCYLKEPIRSQFVLMPNPLHQLR